jgi:hypothetical protein
MWWPDLFQLKRMQILTTQLIDDIAGVTTEEELMGHFKENEERFKRTAANRTGTPENEITFNDVREDVEREVKNKKAGEIWGTLHDDLKEKYKARNYITGEGLEPEEEVDIAMDLSEEESEETEGESETEGNEESG